MQAASIDRSSKALLSGSLHGKQHGATKAASKRTRERRRTRGASKLSPMLRSWPSCPSGGRLLPFWAAPWPRPRRCARAGDDWEPNEKAATAQSAPARDVCGVYESAASFS